jgi:hypothetical protein
VRYHFKTVSRVKRQVAGLSGLQIGACSLLVAHIKSGLEEGAPKARALLVWLNSQDTEIPERSTGRMHLLKMTQHMQRAGECLETGSHRHAWQ